MWLEWTGRERRTDERESIPNHLALIIARRLEWLAFDNLLASWSGAFGGSDPAGAEPRQRGGRHPARAGLVYLARRHTPATNAELAAALGLSRAESVPNLTRRFSDWLSIDAKIRNQLRDLESVLEGS
jgi:hypothetical protein